MNPSHAAPPRRPAQRLVPRILALFALLGAPLAAADALKSFDISRGEALATLKQFSAQSEARLLYSVDAVKGVQTNAIKGSFTPRVALDRLVANTGLIVTESANDGALALSRGRAPVPNEPRAAPPTASDRPGPSPTRAASDAGRGSEGPIQLSPFEVNVDSRGYYGANTMAGTRLNSKIEDLAASITVITKEQMQDFGMLDINDIFAYEAGTEGLGSYTEFSFNTDGGTTDDASLNPQGSNRIRGIGAANTAFGNFETSGRVPIDPIDIDGVEISRGPNSSIFGIGNIAGTVNMVPTSANLSRNNAQVTARADSFEGFRTSLDVNRVLQAGRLAVRGSIVYQREGYDLKPSGIDTVRYNGMVKYRPFKHTTLTAAVSDYRAHGSRRNYLTPSDGVTDWINNGRPSFDPFANIQYLNGAPVPLNGTVLTGAQGNILAFVDNGNLEHLAMIRWSNVNNPVTAAPVGRSYRQSQFRVLYPNQPLFLTKLPITDRSIYDWGSVNLGSANYHRDEAQTTRVMLDQVFLSTSQQQLAAQLGWFREQTESYSQIAVGIPRRDGDSNPIFIDVNTRLLDGRTNPYFGRPYIATLPHFDRSPAERDTYRLQLAYRLDLRESRGWTRWLGTHSVSAYGEYKNFVQRRARWRNTYINEPAWFPRGASHGGNAGNGVGGAGPLNNVLVPALHRIYIGDAVGGNVDYGPRFYENGPKFLEWGDGTTWVREPVEWGPTVVNGTGLAGNTWTKLKSQGVVLQSHLLKDRIIPTFGWRHDESYTRIGGEFRSPDGVSIDWDSFNSWEPGDWTKGAGPTRTEGLVVKPLRWLSLFANRSNSFRPSAPKQDLYNRRLPDPHGVGKDYGVALNLFSDRLVLKYNRYITRQLQTPNGPSATYVNRIRRIDFNDFSASSPPQLADTFNLQRHAATWATAEARAQGRTLSQSELDARVAAIMQVPVEFLAPPPWDNGAADDTLASGYEIEVNYNPTNAWTMKFNVTKQETINERIAPEVKQWVEERLPVWRSIIDPTTGQPWYTSVYEGSTMSADSFVRQNVLSQIDQLRATEGLSRPQIRKYRANFSTNFHLSGITDQKYLKRFNVGGAVRWEDKAAIGYYGVQQPPAIVTQYDLSRPIYDKAHAYFDFLLGYRTRLFSERVSARFQLNVRNLNESGRLQPIGAFPDGTPYAYRIVDPRLFILSASFDL